MKREQPMKNLWMISGTGPPGLVTHNAGLRKGTFVPIYFGLKPLKQMVNPELSRSGASPISC
jgi:hypothetical protein